MADTVDDPMRAKIMNVRIEGDLHAILKARSAATGRPMTTEAIRLMRKGLAQEEALGARAENGFDLMLAYAVRGVRGAIEELLQHSSPMELRQFILSAETSSRNVS
jgi:plasmid stability protein